MGAEYYDRVAATNTDGTPIFATSVDRQSEKEVAAILEKQWRVSLHKYPEICQIDWYASRDERLVALLELKSRSHALRDFPTVFLNFRKWIALTMGTIGMGVPSFFVARFTDGIRWIDIANVDARKHRIGGCRTQVKSSTDREIVIEVPLTEMRELKTQTTS